MTNDLFDFTHHRLEEGEAPHRSPLAHRLRPESLESFVGQHKVLAPGKPLRSWIESDRVPSLIFWGPPGCGKTTLAQIVARQTQSYFISLSAVLSGVKGIKEAVEKAKHTYGVQNRKTILFVDEIHRFNKSQQDALLPHIENGTLTLIGATTENPSFELNRALLSRARVIRLEPLETEDLVQILNEALSSPPPKGLGSFLKLDDEAMTWLAETSEGDARRALTALENVALSFGQTSPEETSSTLTLKQTQDALESALERQPIPYDKNGEEHYNVVSAFIKSMRLSQPDAALYYMARMIEGGEDPIFIARRMVVFASEDVGNADPRALQIAMNAKEAVEFVGLPEARINLGHAVSYLAVCPKSRASYQATEKAFAAVRKHGALSVPMHLRNAVTPLMKEQGYGEGYGTGKECLPNELAGCEFYHPTENGLEKQMSEKLKRIRKNQT